MARCQVGGITTLQAQTLLRGLGDPGLQLDVVGCDLMEVCSNAAPRPVRAGEGRLPLPCPPWSSYCSPAVPIIPEQLTLRRGHFTPRTVKLNGTAD